MNQFSTLENESSKEGMRKLAFVIGLLLILVAGGWMIHAYEQFSRAQKDESAIKQLVAEGDKALNVGRYSDAKRIFSEELKINPKNPEASWGLKKAEVGEVLSGNIPKETIESLYQENPNDCHIALFMGEYHAINGEADKARSYYESAIELAPKLAEAHYVLAQLNEQQGDLNGARVEYLKAITLSPESIYQNSLATIYFKQKQYEAAIKEYGKNLEYPLSSLYSAKIFWQLGYLTQALSYQRQAIKFLGDEAVMSKVDNQDSWNFDIAPGKTIKLVRPEEKKSYAYLSLAATLFMQGNTKEAESEIQTVRSFKVFSQTDINTLLKIDLDTLLQGNAEVSGLVEAFKKQYL